MAVPKNSPDADECDNDISDEALALIEHIGAILAEEYVALMKASKTEEHEGEVVQ